MADPSFDDLLDSLDAIQAEQTHRRKDSSSSSSSSSDDEKKNKHKQDNHNDFHIHEEHHVEYIPPPPPVRQATDYEYSSPSHYDSGHHVSHDHAPIQTYSAPTHHVNHAATPSRTGDMKQYQRQSVIQPARAQQHHTGAGDSHCAKCGNSLYGTEFVTASGKNYHQEHFTCTKCGVKLLGAYYDHHSQVYCPNCAGDLMPCSKCHRGITGQYMVLDGRPHHNECIERKNCAGCHRVIEDTVLTALGKTWHSHCFKCLQCGRELGKEFISKDGHGQCVSCADRARPQCAKCHNPLSGEFINFQNTSYHQDCFVCAQCRTRLGTSGFFNVGGALKCQRCAK